MAATLNIHECKTQLSAPATRAEAGRDIVIARAKRFFVRRVAVRPSPVRQRLGEAKGLVTMAPDFEALPDDFMDEFR